MSELARRGVAARAPLSERNGFPVFEVGTGAPEFGAEEVAEAMASEEREAARGFLGRGR